MRIIGIGVCGQGEATRYLKETLNEFKRLCDDTIIVFCNAGEGEKQLIKKFGFWQYEDNREWGKFQFSIKTDLLKRAGRLNPDWIIALDMDEVFDEHFSRREAELLTSQKEIGFHFYIVNLWNDKEHYNKGLSFWNIRFYQFRPELGLDFARKNVHCGLAPPVFYHYGWHAPFHVEHCGLLTQENRALKIKRYEQYDPRAIFKGKEYYEALKYNGAGSFFNKEELRNKLRALPEGKARAQKPIPMIEKDKKEFVYVRRVADGATLDIPLKNWQNMEANRDLRGKFQFIGKATVTSKPTMLEIPIIKDDSTAPLPDFKADTSEKAVNEPEVVNRPKSCPLCGFEAKNAHGLAMHKTKIHG